MPCCRHSAVLYKLRYRLHTSALGRRCVIRSRANNCRAGWSYIELRTLGSYCSVHTRHPPQALEYR